MGRHLSWRFALFAIFVALVAAVVVFQPPWFAEAFSWVNRDQIAAMANRAGLWGPLLIIVLMCVAVVFSPIPSAPIALAAGAVFGHTEGSFYVLIGAEIGAMIAFALARILGRETMRRWFGERLSGMKFLGSQAVLMWIVFASRLMPFISFDLVSYAAGLSSLTFWRFALATLAGIIPASFLLAHFGAEMASGQAGSAFYWAVALGFITGLPVLWAVLRRLRGRHLNKNDDTHLNNGD